MEAAAPARTRRIAPAMRQTERVSPLELFFDLVFVLAITQCTALMADNPTWEGIGQGLLVLALLWWAWGGYAWLTSVLDPEDGAVRGVIFGAMVALLIVALCVPQAFGSLALEFALAYGAVRVAHIAVFVIASRDDPALRRSVGGLAVGTAVGIALLITGSFFDGWGQAAIWGLALLLDLAEPYIFGAEGWKLVPGHFVERFALIIIIALGESIVAIGVGAEAGLGWGEAGAAALGVLLACAMWWLYFDVVALVSAKRLAEASVGRIQNEMARDSYGYLHYLLVAGVVLVALGLKKTLGNVEDPLKAVPEFALLGGVAIYLLGHVAIRLRNIGTLNRQRLVMALVLLAAIPLAVELDALIVLALLTAAVWALIVFETRRYGEARQRLRAELAHGR